MNFLANVYSNVCWQQQEGCDPLLFFWTFRFHSSFHALEMQQLALNWRREKKLIWCQIQSSIIFWIAAAPTWFCKNFYTMTRRKYYGSYVTRSIFEGLKYNQSKLMSRLSGSMDIWKSNENHKKVFNWNFAIKALWEINRKNIFNEIILIFRYTLSIFT